MSAPPKEQHNRLERAEALELYRRLLLARLAQERIREEYAKNDMKTPVHLGVGQEAISIGVLSVVPPGTKTFGTYRNHTLYLTVTQDLDGFFGELYGKMSGVAKGKAGSMHLASPEHGLVATSAVVGSTIPLAVGTALANRYRRVEGLVVIFFGDGAVDEGVFWESLNFACLKRLHVLFVCEDNGLAVHTPTSERHGFRSISEAIAGFNCHVHSGDGSDLIGVMGSTRDMLHRMHEEPKPGFLHFTCYRFMEHVGPLEDFNAGYRRRPSPEEWARLDPVQRFEQHVGRNGYSEAELLTIRRSLEEQIDRSVRAAQQAPFPPTTELTTDVLS